MEAKKHIIMKPSRRNVDEERHYFFVVTFYSDFTIGIFGFETK